MAIKRIRNCIAAMVAVFGAFALCTLTQGKDGSVVPRPHPLPPPVVNVAALRADEKPIAVEKSEAVVVDNGFFRRVKTTFTFTNPNARAMAGEFEFPMPAEAFVCGYALEVNGEMIPGVVCEKDKARVAFENEMRKGVDPGLVEQVNGNVWRTRIFPLNPKTPRKAEVEWIARSENPSVDCVYERDGGELFCARLADVTNDASRVKMSRWVWDNTANFSRGVILWDASLSAAPHAAVWRERLKYLPDSGEWTFRTFRHCLDDAQTFTRKADLLAAIDDVVYDGGTSLERILKGVSKTVPSLLFTDEIATMDMSRPAGESPLEKFHENFKKPVFIGREAPPLRRIIVEKLYTNCVPESVKESTLLATVWASRQMQDLAAQADVRKDEFLGLGRKYGVAGPGLSLIVLETLEQWLEHKIEPPTNLTIHAEWVKRRAAMDDPIAAKRERAEYEQQLLKYWEERVNWWKNPKPPKRTPKSGLFDGAVAAAPHAEMALADAAVNSSARMQNMTGARSVAAPAKAKDTSGVAGSGTIPTVTLKAWDPKAPYIDALKAAAKGKAYAVYLKEREKQATSPAFYLDCADWFFKAGETNLAERIITNLAEFKLENAALWRTMGWRLRAAGSYELASTVFLKVVQMRSEEAQSFRDLSLVLAEWGKRVFAAGNFGEAKNLLSFALESFMEAVFSPRLRRSGRRGNDIQVSVVALEELNGLISWIEAQKWPDGMKPKIPEFDAVYRRDLPVKLRIVLSWDADQTDIDLHVLEPNGEEAFYGHRRTSEGGFVSEDVTTGYGPEEYLKKELEEGVYKVLSNYFASHQTALTGATTVTATVHTDWGTAQERMKILTLRLDQPKAKHLIGEVKLR